MAGKTFGRFLVLKLAPDDGRHTRHWLCRCSCGTEKIVSGSALRMGGTVSCGCFGRENSSRLKTKHGASTTPTYLSWRGMLGRCYNKRDPFYQAYGGRGIVVCKRWRFSFINFLEDMGKRPIGMTLDRIKNNENYTPANCQWATPKQQARNRRDSRHIIHDGKSKTIAEWAEIFGLSQDTLRCRIAAGWDTETALMRRAHHGLRGAQC